MAGITRPSYSLYIATAMLLFPSLLLFFLVAVAGFNLAPDKPGCTRWVLTKDCSLKVGGSTNLNKFSCVIGNYNRPDTLMVYNRDATLPIKISGCIVMDVESFDCRNPVMTRDLRRTLKAKAFPRLIIRFINLSRYPAEDAHRTDPVKGALTIQLAGVTKRFEVEYLLMPGDTNSLTLVGSAQVKFSDFNLVPPKKIGGMIQTNDELDVEFNLQVKVLD
jgi:hypothetical protein